MSEPDSCSTIAAGNKVTRGASSERKTKSRSTMMNRIDSAWVLLPVELEDFCSATLVGTTPARWNCRPGGAPTFANWAVSPFTTCSEGVMLKPAMFASASSWTACPSLEVPTYCTVCTRGTFFAATASRPSARVSATVIGPLWLRPMMMIGCRVDLPTSGTARLPATVLGALAGRKAELSLFTSLASDGRKWTEAAVPTSHTTTISQRNRTVKRPRPRKNAFIRQCLRLELWGSARRGLRHRPAAGSAASGGRRRT